MTDNKHWTLFPEFVRQELAAGGPDPQIALIKELASVTDDPRRKIWLAGCYCAHHCVPSAFVVWKQFPDPATVYFDSSGGFLEAWLRQNWAHLPVRPEMRSHRMPEKRAKCLKDFAQYALEWTPERTAKSYNDVWDDAITSVKFFGRYMAIKFLELMRVIVEPRLEMPDMRAKGSWSPRKTLSMLYPHVEVLGIRQNESLAALQEVDTYAEFAVIDLWSNYRLKLNLFQLQVLLCEYKEALAGGFYPGGTHDEELEYIRKVEEGFGPEILAPIFQARRKLFPNELLGELNGWIGLRKEKFQIFKGSVHV